MPLVSHSLIDLVACDALMVNEYSMLQHRAQYTMNRTLSQSYNTDLTAQTTLYFSPFHFHSAFLCNM